MPLWRNDSVTARLLGVAALEMQARQALEPRCGCSFQALQRAPSSLALRNPVAKLQKSALSTNELKPGTRRFGSRSKPSQEPPEAGSRPAKQANLGANQANTSTFNSGRGLWQVSVSHKLCANRHPLTSLGLSPHQKFERRMSISQGSCENRD